MTKSEKKTLLLLKQIEKVLVQSRLNEELLKDILLKVTYLNPSSLHQENLLEKIRELQERLAAYTKNETIQEAASLWPDSSGFSLN